MSEDCLEAAEAEAETPVVMEVEGKVVSKAWGLAPVVEKGKAVADSGMEAEVTAVVDSEADSGMETEVTAVVDSEAGTGLLCLWSDKHTSSRTQW